MVTVLPKKQNEPNILTALLGGIGGHLEERKNEGRLREENRALQKLGVEAEGIRDPALRKALLKTTTKQQDEQQKKQQGTFEDIENYQTIERAFGKEAADLYKSAPVGGKTELLRSFIDAKTRGYDLKELIGGGINDAEMENPPSLSNPQMGLDNDLVKKETKADKMIWPKFDKKPAGYTPKEWQEQKVTWRKENVPIYQETKTKLANAKRDEMDIKKLKQLSKSKKLPEDFQRFLINPDTNDFYTPAKVLGFQSPEAEEWSKVIARFGNRAKDAFGSRVTNFDLVQYMRQFPSLLNSPEGRERILEMMEINNQLDKIYSQALNTVYEKYKLNGIPQEEAESLAMDMIREETEELKEKYLSLDRENQEADAMRNKPMQELPPASEAKGRIATDIDTGKKYKSDGINWVLVK